MGGRSVPRYARLESSAGMLRLVVRVGMDQDFESVEIGAWDDSGKPLQIHAPATGEKADAKVGHVVAIAPPERWPTVRVNVSVVTS